MKKSEVIRDLAIFLMGRLPEWQKTERLKFADEIINELEIIGMQPPLHIFEDQHESYCATYDNDECTCNPFRDNTWEPEE